MLLSRISLLFVFSITLTMVYFVYGTIVLLSFLIAIINIQPFKEVVVRYPLIDPVFFVLFSLFYISLLGRTISSVRRDQYHKVMTPIAFTSALIPLAYIFLLVGLWFVSRRRWINELVYRLQQ